MACTQQYVLYQLYIIGLKNHPNLNNEFSNWHYEGGFPLNLSKRLCHFCLLYLHEPKNLHQTFCECSIVLQGSWKPGHWWVKAGIDWGVLWVPSQCSRFDFFSHVDLGETSKDGGSCILPQGQDKAGVHACILEREWLLRLSSFKYCSSLLYLLFWFIFAIVLHFLYKIPPADFCLFCLFWPHPKAP